MPPHTSPSPNEHTQLVSVVPTQAMRRVVVGLADGAPVRDCATCMGRRRGMPNVIIPGRGPGKR